MFRKLFKRQPIPMPTTRDSLESVARILGYENYTMVDDTLLITTNPLGDESDIIGGIEVKIKLSPPTTTIEPRTATATYAYATKSYGVQQEFTRWDVTNYPMSATISEQIENTVNGVRYDLWNIKNKHRLD